MQNADKGFQPLTKEAASEIYKRDFWDKCSCDQLPDPIAALVFDTAVNMGTHTAVSFLQTAAGVSTDGVIGSQTLAAIKRMDPVKFGKAFMGLRIKKLSSLATWDRFGLGWTGRCFDVFYQAFLG